MIDKPFRRRSIRLKDYDYTQAGAYFVTLCTFKRACLFGKVVDGEMKLNRWGQIVEEEWEKTGVLRRAVLELDASVVMPNHFHGVVVLKGTMPPAPARQFDNPIPNSLSTIVGAFKAAVTRRMNRLPHPPEHPIWQRNYYENIIRDEALLNKIRVYCEYNPAKWHEDSIYVGA